MDFTKCVVTVILLANFGAASDQHASDGVCSPRDMNPAPGQYQDVLAIDRLKFDSDGHTSTVEMEVRNRSSKGIVSILLLVELQSTGGIKITIPVHARSATEDVSQLHDLWIPISPVIEEIKPGATQRFVSDMPIVSTECPARARIALAEVKFAGGTEFNRSEDWRTAAMPMKLPISNLPVQLLNPDMQTLVTAIIDATGKVTLKDVQSPSDETRSWLAETLSQWLFTPALHQGRAEESEQSWVFRFRKYEGPEPPYTVHNLDKSGVFTSIAVYSAVPDSKQPVVIFGQGPGYYSDGNPQELHSNFIRQDQRM
jgi:hypothetical protein